MKLYHATHIDNLADIQDVGILPQQTRRFSNDPQYDDEGVYGFTNISDAEGFAADQGWMDDFAIVEFESYDYIDDPEYDGEAKIDISGRPMTVTRVFRGE